MRAWISRIYADFPNEPDAPDKTVELKIGEKTFSASYWGGESESGRVREVTLSILDTDSDNTPERAFKGNPNKILDLDHDSSYSYHGYGKIVSTSPTVCTFGVIELEIGLPTTPEDLGEFVYWYIDRLDIEFE